MTRYQHTQIGYSTICALFGVAAFVAVMQIVASADHGGLVISAIIEVILLVCALVFSKLTIKVDDRILRAYFAIGVICKKVRLSEITGCDPIRIRWWYGWGIHLTPYGWLYNVSGFDAVAITLREGRRFLLGTDDPRGLVAAITNATR